MTGVVERCLQAYSGGIVQNGVITPQSHITIRAVLREALRGIGDEHLAALLRAVGDSSDVDDSLDLAMLHTVLSEIMEETR